MYVYFSEKTEQPNFYILHEYDFIKSKYWLKKKDIYFRCNKPNILVFIKYMDVTSIIFKLWQFTCSVAHNMMNVWGESLQL